MHEAYRAGGVVEHARTEDRVVVRVDDHGVVRVTVWQVGDHVVVVAAGVGRALVVQLHLGMQASIGRVVDVLALCERYETERDVRYDRIAGVVDYAAATGEPGTAGLPPRPSTCAWPSDGAVACTEVRARG